jgi:ketosteroid isomerase-like protein
VTAPDPAAVVRAYTEAWLSGDLDTVLALYHDDLVLHYGGNHSLTGDHVGRDAALTALLTIQARTERVPLEVIDVMSSDDHAVAWVRERWTVGGVPHELTRVLVFRVADDQLVECWLYDNDNALVDRALG